MSCALRPCRMVAIGVYVLLRQLFRGPRPRVRLNAECLNVLARNLVAQRQCAKGGVDGDDLLHALIIAKSNLTELARIFTDLSLVVTTTEGNAIEGQASRPGLSVTATARRILLFLRVLNGRVSQIEVRNVADIDEDLLIDLLQHVQSVTTLSLSMDLSCPTTKQLLAAAHKCEFLTAPFQALTYDELVGKSVKQFTVADDNRLLDFTADFRPDHIDLLDLGSNVVGNVEDMDENNGPKLEVRQVVGQIRTTRPENLATLAQLGQLTQKFCLEFSQELDPGRRFYYFHVRNHQFQGGFQQLVDLLHRSPHTLPTQLHLRGRITMVKRAHVDVRRELSVALSKQLQDPDAIQALNLNAPGHLDETHRVQCETQQLSVDVVVNARNVRLRV